MKSIHWLLPLVLAFSISSQSTANDEVVKIVGDPWPPWMEYTEDNEKISGIFVDITKEIFNRTGLAYEIKLHPFKRSVDFIKSGKRDVMLMISSTPQREEFMAFSDVVLSDPYLLYYNPEKTPGFQWDDWKDLSSYRIGIVNGFNYGEEFNNAVAEHGIKTEVVREDMQNVRKLLAGRFQLIILNRTNADRIKSEYPGFSDKLIAAEKVLYESHYPLAFSKKSPHLSLIPKINLIIREIQQDGTLEMILKKHGKSSD